MWGKWVIPMRLENYWSYATHKTFPRDIWRWFTTSSVTVEPLPQVVSWDQLWALFVVGHCTITVRSVLAPTKNSMDNNYVKNLVIIIQCWVTYHLQQRSGRWLHEIHHACNNVELPRVSECLQLFGSRVEEMLRRKRLSIMMCFKGWPSLGQSRPA